MSCSPNREVNITIEEPLAIAVSEAWLHLVMEHALEEALEPDQSGQVSVLLTGDTTVRELNRQYRGLDEVTDVLSFSAQFPGHWEGDGDPSETSVSMEDEAHFVMPPDQIPPLGEIIISYPQAQRQAAEKGQGLERELALLLVHGALHLVGHDHLDAADTASMQARERAALKSIFQSGVPTL